MTCSHCEDLREEVASLRRQLCLDVDFTIEATFAKVWGLAPKPAKLLALLYQRGSKIAPIEYLMCGIYGENMDAAPFHDVLAVYVCKLRKKLPANSIGTVHGHGWFLTESGVETCAFALDPLKAAA